MATVEKLLVQLFERKHSIIDLVKQQTESYSQHLACEFLIDGITPPSWFWDPSTSSSKELSKEDLISKILRPSVCYSVAHYPEYTNLVITGDNEELSDGVFVQNRAFNKDLARKDDLTTPGFTGHDRGECELNWMPELDASVASPEDQTDGRILNIYTAPDQSLTGIQRSKSRQKALELRSSAKALAKSGLRHESTSDVVTSQIRFSLSVANQPGQNDELTQSAEPSVIGSQSCEERNVVEAHCLSRETGVDTHSVRLTRSGSYAEVPISVEDSLPLGCSSINYKVNASCQDARAERTASLPILGPSSCDYLVSSQNMPSLSIANQPGQIDELSQSVEPSEIGGQSCEERNVVEAHCLSREKELDTDPERITRCGSYAEVPISVEGSFSLGCLSEKYKENASCQEARAKRIESLPILEPSRCDYLVSSQSMSSLSIANQPGQNDELSQFVEPSVIGGQSCEERNVVEAHCLSRETKLDTHNERITRCGSYSEVPISVEDDFSLGCSSEKYKKNASSQDARAKRTESLPILGPSSCDYRVSSQMRFSLSIANQPGQNDELSQSAEPSVIGSQSCEERNVVEAHCLSRETGVDTILGPSSCDNLVSSQSMISLSIANQPGQNDELSQSAEPSVIGSQSCEERNVVEAHCLSRETGVDTILGPSSCDYLVSSQSMISLSIANQSVQNDELPQSAEPSVIGGQSCEERNVVEAHCLSRETGVDTHTERITRCRSYAEFPISVEGSLPLGCSSEYYKVNASSQDARAKRTESLPILGPSSRDYLVLSPSMSSLSIANQPGQIDELSQSVEPSEIGGQSCEERNVVEAHCLSREKELVTYPERITRRGSYAEVPISVEGSFSLGCSSEKYKENASSQDARAKRIESLPILEPSSCDYLVSSQSMSSLSIANQPGQNDELSQFVEPSVIGSQNCEERNVVEAHCLSRETELDTHPERITRRGSYAEVPISLEGSFPLSYSSEKYKENASSQDARAKRTDSLPILGPSSCDYLDSRTSGDKQYSEHLCNLESAGDNLNTENLDFSSTLYKETQIPKWEDGLHAHHSVLGTSNEDMQLTDADQSMSIFEDGLHVHHSVLSSRNEDLQLTDVDQSMPVFEGFTVNTPADTGEHDFAAGEFDLGKLELPRTTLERASILVEICRSASLDSPSSHFASAFKFQETWNLCESLPDDGHIEHIESGDIYTLNPDVGIHIQRRSSSTDDYKDALDGMPYSAPLAYSGERYGWNSRNQLSSPVGKLWDQLSSHTGSSGKCSSSNPELTCFPIEEDPSSSEDNKIMEENAGDTQDETESSLANYSDKRQPLKDLTNMGKSSAGEATLRSDSLDFLTSKLSVTKTQDQALLGPKYQFRTREKQTSSIGAADGSRKRQTSSIAPSAIKKAKQSVNHSTVKSMRNKISKTIVLNKTSLKEQDQKLSLTESRRNNIVSNVSSFIPLVQQKQAATDCTGRRDVKVKALEAAEAAKRLEERKENERKMRKEALKIERAKLEEKNLREIVLEKKKKEEERKKKDADIIAKKRLREEEERKEKEKKRMRVEARQQQREQEEKKRAERLEKENQRTKNAQMNNKKEFNNESKRQQNRETTKGEGVTLQNTDTNWTRNEVVVNYEECGISGLSCEAGEAMDAVDKTPTKEDLPVQNSKGKSYEISPYQCSEDEDEGDEELPTKKYIPSWASKSSIALLLPLQRELDPDVIFPPDRFCSMDAVLLPRKLQKQQAAT